MGRYVSQQAPRAGPPAEAGISEAARVAALRQTDPLARSARLVKLSARRALAVSEPPTFCGGFMGPQELAQSGAAAVSPAALETLKQRAAECIELSAGRLSALSREIWSRPELAFEEHQAHGALTRFFSCAELPGAAWAVQPHYKLDTAFRAEWGPAAPAPAPRPLHLGFLCEYDALPGIGHACGHNLIAEVGAAAALGVKGALESLPQPVPAAVKITVLGTPAEEGGGGKIDLIAAGAFDDLDVVFMAHPAQSDAAYLPDVAEHDVTVKYYGKASHAAAYPWEGVNALDAAVLAYNNISVLRQQMKPTWRVHGIIKNGGVKPNIIPSYTELEFYLRAPSRKDLTILTERAENCFKAAAVATECKVEIKGGRHDYYNVLQNKSLEKTYTENGKELGMEFLADESFLNGPSGSTDFGNVTYVVPGIHPYFYIGSDALNHTEPYTAASGPKNFSQPRPSDYEGKAHEQSQC
ncbi:xaa-Arg dipeptidase isoform X3 [Gopherus flavomarginatus]|uniref:xaa-Arg dipeptidase isoform X3 n=1 Tax=Gopherus flavomarginatus TaxID=286002 RepID=UPI0021CC4354|nr:xaa-Arg dipeptidase isoform X3 [Gopherus flavomarginatus]